MGTRMYSGDSVSVSRVPVVMMRAEGLSVLDWWPRGGQK